MKKIISKEEIEKICMQIKGFIFDIHDYRVYAKFDDGTRAWFGESKKYPDFIKWAKNKI